MLGYIIRSIEYRLVKIGNFEYDLILKGHVNIIYVLSLIIL